MLIKHKHIINPKDVFTCVTFYRFTFSNFGKFLGEVGDPLPFFVKRVTPTL